MFVMKDMVAMEATGLKTCTAACKALDSLIGLNIHFQLNIYFLTNRVLTKTKSKGKFWQSRLERLKSMPWKVKVNITVHECVLIPLQTET